MANHVLLSGLPGVGKTTLVCNLYEILKEKNIPMVGFYTREVKINCIRVGFDIITLDGQIGKLARSMESVLNKQSQYKVGKYSVLVDEFERLVLPILQKPQPPDTLVIIDEIGRMELFSQLFNRTIRKLFQTPNLKILATIPVARGKTIPLVESLRNDPQNIVITVDQSNRNHLTEEILHRLQINMD